MKSIGTILPDARTSRLHDEFDKRVKDQQARIARKHFPGIVPVVVGDESRYYETPNTYAIISRRGSILRFQVTPNGDQSTSSRS